MPFFQVTLSKTQRKRTAEDTLLSQLQHISNRGVAGDRKLWSVCDISGYDTHQILHDQIRYLASIKFQRKKNADPEVLTSEMREIIEVMRKASNTHKWDIESQNPDWKNTKDSESSESSESSDNDCVNFTRVLSYEEIQIPEVLIYGSDDEIESHPAFSNLYGRGAHVRTMGSSMQTMIATRGARRNHLTLHGLPGCGKSTLFSCWQSVIGEGSYLRINANSASKAGLEYLFLVKLEELGVPPFIFVEEMEKTQENILTTWLSILDERAEVNKIIHRKLKYTSVQSLVFATVNDKILFDRLMGGRPNCPGALSSRMTGIYVPRPDEDLMRRILMRDISRYYPEAGLDASLWADKCIELAHIVNTNDPRQVATFLDGRDRLLTGEYQNDIVKLYQMEKADAEQCDTETF